MKKFILSCASAFALFALVSCSGNTGKAIDILEEGTEQLKEAKGDRDKLHDIYSETHDKLKDLTKDLDAQECVKIADDEDYKKAEKEFRDTYNEEFKKGR